MYHVATIGPKAATRLVSGVTIRASKRTDEAALRRLAQLDSSRPPEGPSLIALEGETPRAAISLVSGETLADPFHRTSDLVELLRRRADQLNGRRRGLRARLLALARGERHHVAPQPAGILQPTPARQCYRLSA